MMHMVVMVMMPVMVVMVMVMVMVMMVVVMLHRSSGSGFLRDGVTGEAEREHGGSGEGLDHGKVFLRLEEPDWVNGTIEFPR